MNNALAEHERTATGSMGSSPSTGAASLLRHSADHPALSAWMQLAGKDVPSSTVDVLKESSGYCAYRIHGVGVNQTSVIASKCRPWRATKERAIYERFLPRRSVPGLRYYGCVHDVTSDRQWIFVEDAVGDAYDPLDSQCREVAARWLAQLHLAGTSTSARLAADKLPNRGAAYFKRQLESSLTTLHRLCADSEFVAKRDPADIDTLDQLTRHCEMALLRWEDIRQTYTLFPRTIVHGDFAIQNLRVRQRDSEPALLVFDWEDAGWASPAIDLIQFNRDWMNDSAGPDLAVYYAVVKQHWPQVSQASVIRLAEIGRLFWILLALRLDLDAMDREWPDRRLRTLSAYSSELAGVIHGMGWTR